MTTPSEPKRTLFGVGIDEASLRETSSWAARRRETQNASLVGQRVGSYNVTRVIGEGGVGAVYLGEHPLVGSRVAIKVLHDEFVDSSEMVGRFIQEARAANAIANPHIVRVIDFGKLGDGREYAVMEYLEGQTLGALLETESTLAPSRVIGFMRQIAQAIAAAHAAGVVHRDLKPENIFLEQTESDPEFVRILDFGIAKLAHDTETDTLQTGVGAVLGTPVYCAPEQASGKAVGPSCDIYALGAIAYEALTGHAAFEGNVVEILVNKSTRDVAPLDRADVPPALAALVMQMLERDPLRRPASMQHVVERLTSEPLGTPAAKRTKAPTLVSPSQPSHDTDRAAATTDSPTVISQPLAADDSDIDVPIAMVAPWPRKMLPVALTVCAIAASAVVFFRRDPVPTQVVPAATTASALPAPTAATSPHVERSTVTDQGDEPAPAQRVATAAPSTAPSAPPSASAPKKAREPTNGREHRGGAKKATIVDPFHE